GELGPRSQEEPCEEAALHYEERISALLVTIVRLQGKVERLQQDRARPPSLASLLPLTRELGTQQEKGGGRGGGGGGWDLLLRFGLRGHCQPPPMPVPLGQAPQDPPCPASSRSRRREGRPVPGRPQGPHLPGERPPVPPEAPPQPGSPAAGMHPAGPGPGSQAGAGAPEGRLGVPPPGGRGPPLREDGRPPQGEERRPPSPAGGPAGAPQPLPGRPGSPAAAAGQPAGQGAGAAGDPVQGRDRLWWSPQTPLGRSPGDPQSGATQNGLHPPWGATGAQPAPLLPPSTPAELQSSLEQLHRRLEELRGLNWRLSGALQESKANAEQLSLLLGQQESQEAGLALALRGSERCLEAYETLWALTDQTPSAEMGAAAPWA
ncbi:basic proline-rich protein-like, partial [Pseudonaja textilis]|uniref:basic proline-rich protein-like n=1 Tax=Pseudonaja textilis TaxID=8673 RepID=UPI000EAAA734